MHRVWRILLVVVTSLVLVAAGGFVGVAVGEATCTPGDYEILPCLAESMLGMLIGGLAGIGAAIIVGRHLWIRTKAGPASE